MAYVVVNYFLTIKQLTAHNTASAREQVGAPSPSPLASTLMPFVPYAPFVLSALLFIVAFGILVVNRAKNLKNITIAILIAFISASIPTMISYVGQGSRQTANAGPEEIPRNVKVVPVSPTSVLISWNTDAARVGAVRFSTSPLTSQSARLYLADNQEAVRIHSVQIDSLASQSYEFEILSGATWYDNGGSYIRFTIP